MCWVVYKFLERIFEFVSGRCLSGISDPGPFLRYLLSSRRFQHNEDGVNFSSTPTHRTGVEFSFFFYTTRFLFFGFSVPGLCIKIGFLCFLATGWNFLNPFPQGPRFSRVLCFSSLPCTKITFPKPIWPF